MSVSDATSNTTQIQSGELSLTANVGVGITCMVLGGMPPPTVDMFLDGVNITDQVPSYLLIPHTTN